MFEIWKDSIFSRFYIQAFLLIIFTFYLQYIKLNFVAVKGEYVKYASEEALIKKISKITGITDQ